MLERLTGRNPRAAATNSGNSAQVFFTPAKPTVPLNVVRTSGATTPLATNGEGVIRAGPKELTSTITFPPKEFILE